MTHPDIETISDHVEGLLDRAESERIAWHLAGCATCSATVSDLAEVRSVLRAEGQKTVPMPPDMVSRLEAVIEQESAERTVVEASGPPHGAPVRSLDEQRRARRRRYAAGGLIAAAALTVVGVGLGEVLSGGSGDDASTAEAGGAAQEESADRASGKKTRQQELRARRPDSSPDTAEDARALGPQRREALSSVVESVRSRRTDGDDRRKRPACVDAALGRGWEGASYRVRLNGRPGAVVLYPTSDPTDAWVISCGARPRELLHRNLTD